MKLLDVLQVKDRELICLVGGGGKTTTMYALAKALNLQERNVAISTTTSIFYPNEEEVDKFIVEENIEKLHRMLSQNVSSNKIIGFGSNIKPTRKVSGIEGQEIDEIKKMGFFDYLIVEGDGAKGKPIKAPAEHEPVIPSLASIVLVVIGMDGCGVLLNEENVHRPYIISKITGIPLGEVLTSVGIATLVNDSMGLMKGIPSQARTFLLINKVNCEERYRLATRIAHDILSEKDSRIEKILLCNMLTEEQVLKVY